MIPAATSFTLEPRRAVSRTRAPFRDAGILTRIPVRLVLLAAIVLAAYHGLANGASRRRVALVDDAAAVAREQLALRGVRLRIACGVVGAGRRALPHDVGRHAGADHGGPIARSAPDAASAVRVEAVTEGPTGRMGQEAVLPLPSRAVGRPPRVEEDVAPVGVERHAEPRRPEHAGPAIREAPVQMVEATVRPVGPDLQHWKRPRPVGEAELPGGPVAGRGGAVVRQHPLPRLHRPV